MRGSRGTTESLAHYVDAAATDVSPAPFPHTSNLAPRTCFMEVQIFGVKKSAETRKALRFFSDRRIKTHFVDFTERSPSLGELKRFVQKHGLDALIDKESKRYAELGLRHARMSDERWVERLSEEPLMLHMPLVRQIGGNGLTVGDAEAEWKTWTGK